MLPLNSARWSELQASGGGTGELAAQLLLGIAAGDEADWTELYHQCCSQLSVAEVAYAVVPHAIDFASRASIDERVWPLVIAGTVAACREAFPSLTSKVPMDLKVDYADAGCRALLLATQSLAEKCL